MRTRAIDPELLQNLDGLYRYHAVSTISFLHRWLRMIRTQICRGFVVQVPDEEGTVLHDLPEFYDWVSRRYPGLDRDALRIDAVRRAQAVGDDDCCTVEWSDWHGEEAC